MILKIILKIFFFGLGLTKVENNRITGLSHYRTRFSLDSLTYRFNVDVDLSLSKANMKDIPYKLLYKTDFFSVIS